MTTHRRVSSLLALLLICSLAGWLSGCGGGGIRDLAASSLHQPGISANPGDFKVNAAEASRDITVDPRILRTDSLGGPVRTLPMNMRRSSALVNDPAAAAALFELENLATPPGADPVAFAKLKDTMRQMITSPGFKVTMAAPTTKVDDLQGTGDTTAATFTFTYRSLGDYNQDRQVAVADVSPLGQHFGKNTAAADWNVAQVADGNKNGQVDLPDLAPIGMNFGRMCDGYHLEYSADGSTGWTEVADVPWSESVIPVGGGWRVFTHALTPATAGFYRVTPYDSSGDGTSSDAYQWPSGGNQPPNAVLTATPQSGDPTLSVEFDGGGSSDPDAGDSIVKYEFDFGEGAGWEDFGAVSITTHDYTSNGMFTAKLRVTDMGGLTDTDTKIITVGAVGNLFDQALTGVGKARADLNLNIIDNTVPITFGDQFTNYGWDVAPFDDDNDPLTDPVGVPGSRFGGYSTYWHDDQTQLPVWGDGFSDAASSSTDLEDIITAANDKFFEGTSRQTYFATTLPTPGSDYTPAGTDPLATAVINLITNNGGTPDNTAITTDASDVPTELQNALSMVLQAADAAAKARNDYMTGFFDPYDPLTIPDENIWHIAYDDSYSVRVGIEPTKLWSFLVLGITQDSTPAFVASVRPYCCVLDYTVFAQSAINLSHAIDQANSILTGGGISGNFSFDQDTPVGRIVVHSGDGNTTYTQGTDPEDANSYYLLICDVDGDDTYNCTAGGNAGILNPVSINLDLAGNDTYAALDDYSDANGLADDFSSQQGAGRWGVGILADFAGNDTYNTSQAGQGFSTVGWGLLYDAAGDDQYTGVNFVQGAGLFGVGILYDQDGVDDYHAWRRCQGYGDVWGIGMLADTGPQGDTYFSEWDTTVMPNLAGEGDAQGTGMGYDGVTDPDTGEIIIPVILDGGVGLLTDTGGDDTYTCGILGQGCGFWFSTGVLDDRAGNDTYEASLVMQGASYQFGAGLFMDRAGDDKYNTAYATRGFDLIGRALGAAYNAGTAWFLDGGGTDEYFAGFLSLGSGALNGLGYFCDMGSSVDAYNIPVNADDNLTTLGRGYLSQGAEDGSTLETFPTIGVFVDCGGVDTYDANYASIPSGSIGNVSAGNDMGWYRFGYDNDFANNFRLGEFGAGQDGSGITGFEFN